MPDFNAKMHQNRFRLGLDAPDPAGRAHSAPPDPLAGFNGLLLRGGEGREGALDLSVSSFRQSRLRASDGGREGEEKEGGKGERREKGGREEREDKGEEGGKGPSPPEKKSWRRHC